MWVLLYQLLDQTPNLVGEVAWNWRVSSLDNLHGQHVDVLAVEWWLKCAHFVQQHSQRPNVAFEVVWFILDDFWTEIVRCTHDGDSLLDGGVEHLGDTEVAQFDYACFCQEYVLGLQVSVKYLSIVAVLHGQADLSKPVQYGRLLYITTRFFLSFYF